MKNLSTTIKTATQNVKAASKVLNSIQKQQPIPNTSSKTVNTIVKNSNGKQIVGNLVKHVNGEVKRVNTAVESTVNSTVSDIERQNKALINMIERRRLDNIKAGRKNSNIMMKLGEKVKNTIATRTNMNAAVKSAAVNANAVVNAKGMNAAVNATKGMNAAVNAKGMYAAVNATKGMYGTVKGMNAEVNATKGMKAAVNSAVEAVVNAKSVKEANKIVDSVLKAKTIEDVNIAVKNKGVMKNAKANVSGYNRNKTLNPNKYAKYPFESQKSKFKGMRKPTLVKFNNKNKKPTNSKIFIQGKLEKVYRNNKGKYTESVGMNGNKYKRYINTGLNAGLFNSRMV